MLNEWRPVAGCGGLLGDSRCAVPLPDAEGRGHRGRVASGCSRCSTSMADVYKKAPRGLPRQPDRGDQEPHLRQPVLRGGHRRSDQPDRRRPGALRLRLPAPGGPGGPDPLRDTRSSTSPSRIRRRSWAATWLASSRCDPPHRTWQTIPEMVLSVGDRFGDAEAVVDGSLRLTFTQFVDRVRCAAGAFAELGVQQGRPGRRLGAELRGVDDRGVRAADRGRGAGPGQHPVQGRTRPPTSSPAAAPRRCSSRRGSSDRTTPRRPACPAIDLKSDFLASAGHRSSARWTASRARHRRHHLHVRHDRPAQGRDDEPPAEPAPVLGVERSGRPRDRATGT